MKLVINGPVSPCPDCGLVLPHERAESIVFHAGALKRRLVDHEELFALLVEWTHPDTHPDKVAGCRDAAAGLAHVLTRRGFGSVKKLGTT